MSGFQSEVVGTRLMANVICSAKLAHCAAVSVNYRKPSGMVCNHREHIALHTRHDACVISGSVEWVGTAERRLPPYSVYTTCAMSRYIACPSLARYARITTAATPPATEYCISTKWPRRCSLPTAALRVSDDWLTRPLVLLLSLLICLSAYSSTGHSFPRRHTTKQLVGQRHALSLRPSRSPPTTNVGLSRSAAQRRRQRLRTQ